MNLREMAAALQPLWQKARPVSGPTTHDYTLRCAGHDYTFTPIDGGLKGRALGWGHGIRQGDVLHLVNRANRDGIAAYRVESIEYYRDPSDMWLADLSFQRRPAPTLPQAGAR